eukprot:TRINITY_DN4355_c0_g6_i1.p1 TRINITY_DN4355_c0_g6~~TRINITY_DN4355_c0_g6_i1.p1  ORF type:complete len:507 (+),score=80.30 TRINITY_DN4355_c0_g6_i1:94-1614(+)
MMVVDKPPRFEEVRNVWWEVQRIFGPEDPKMPPGEELPKERKEDLLALKKLAEALLNFIEMDPKPENEMESEEMKEIEHLRSAFDDKPDCLPLLEHLGFLKVDGEWQHSEINPTFAIALKHFTDFKCGEAKEPEDSIFSCFAKSDSDEVVETSPEVDLDIDKLIDQILQKREAPNFDEMVTICQRARRTLELEENIPTLEPPCTVVGDIHGQFDDLTEQVLKIGGDPRTTKYVFLGDFVDRGNDSLLCMALILLYKLRSPENIIILRGNHESRITNTIYGFHDECRKKYSKPEHMGPQSQYSGKPDSKIWTLFNHLFDAFPLAAVIGGKVFCCHGGLSPLVSYPHQVLCFNRFQDIMPRGLMADLTWSDPGAQKGFQPNVRGSGCLFGPDETDKFCVRNGLDFVCRAHQCVKDGWKKEQDGRVITVFSAPNYCFAENKGAIMLLDEKMEYTCRSYEHTPTSAFSDSPPPANDYFGNDMEESEELKDIDAPPLPVENTEVATAEETE